MSGNELSRSVPAAQWTSAILPILDEGHNLKLPLSGLSMSPLLVGGRDEVLISTVLGKRLKRGDVVLYVQKDGTHVLHRVHHVKNNMYYMLGDAQVWIEGPVEAENVLAVATALIRKNRMISCSRYDYLLISHMWLLLRPIRPKILRIARGFYRLLKRP